jgi:uncharacterized membrane protein YfcA
VHIDPYIVLGSAIIGLFVGMTGAGGGALMTPMLILLFHVQPDKAIASDLVAAVLMRPLGAVVHFRQGTVNKKLVGLLALGSVPMAFLGSYLLYLIRGHADSAQTDIERLLGAALLVGAAAMVFRFGLDVRSGNKREGVVQGVHIHVARTVMIGMVGGLIVGMTSVGSGSLMIVLMLFLYPMLGANQLVGTDLAQALPLTASAALGALIFGNVSFGVTTSLIIGSIPAVLVGSVLSSRAPDRVIRPVITFVIMASGLKYIGVGNKTLGWSLVGILFAGFAGWLLLSKPWSSTPKAPADDEPSSAAAAET